MAAGSVTTIGARLKLIGGRAFGSGIQGASRDTDKLGRSFGKMGKAAKIGFAGVGLAAAGGAVALGKYVDTGIKSLQRIEMIGAQTDAVIKSTGRAANVSRKHIEDLGGALEAQTATEQETIQQGQNMLLTFTNVRNEAGKGNKVFDQATRVMVDMARAFDKTGEVQLDQTKTAMQLGKALNDPVKGVTALRKVGVTFTKDQQKQIATMVKSGKTLDAQKIILAELNKEFGGSAKAFGNTTVGKIERVKHAYGTLQETIADKLSPAIGGVADWLVAKGIPAMDRFGAFATRKLTPAIQWITKAFDRAQPTLSRVGNWIKTVLFPAAQQGRASQLDGMRKGWESLSKSFQRNSPWLKAVGSGLLTLTKKALPAWVKIQAKLTGEGFHRLGQALAVAIDGTRLALVGMSKFGRFTVNTFGEILHASAKAFGWVPKLGDQLKSADAAFDTFRDNANRAFDEIDATLEVKVDTRQYDRFIQRTSGPLPTILPPLSIATPRGAAGVLAGPVGRAPVKQSAKRSLVAVNSNVTVNLDGRRVSKEQSRVQAAQRAWR